MNKAVCFCVSKPFVEINLIVNCLFLIPLCNHLSNVWIIILNVPPQNKMQKEATVQTNSDGPCIATCRWHLVLLCHIKYWMILNVFLAPSGLNAAFFHVYYSRQTNLPKHLRLLSSCCYGNSFVWSCLLIWKTYPAYWHLFKVCLLSDILRHCLCENRKEN